MRILLTILIALILTTCAGLDRLGTDDSRTDAVHTVFAIESMPYDQLAKKCREWPTARACTIGTSIYVQGESKRTVVIFTTQFLNWADLGDKCGRFTGTGSCYEGGILYTSSGYGNYDRYRMGGIGDEIDIAFGLGIEFNHRSYFGHEVYTHILGIGQDARYISGPPHI